MQQDNSQVWSVSYQYTGALIVVLIVVGLIFSFQLVLPLGDLARDFLRDI
jgi:hypothetical protein